jgi:hypothetical protein
MNYEDLEIDWHDPRPSVLDTERWQRVKRNKDAESEILMGLFDKGFRQEDQLFQRYIKGAAEVLSELTDEGWRVQGQNRKPFRGGRITELSISSGIEGENRRLSSVTAAQGFFPKSGFPTTCPYLNWVLRRDIKIAAKRSDFHRPRP